MSFIEKSSYIISNTKHFFKMDYDLKERRLDDGFRPTFLTDKQKPRIKTAFT